MNNDDIEDFSGLADLEIEVLDLSENAGLTDVTSLATMPALKTLILRSTRNVANGLDDLAGISTLESIDLHEAFFRPPCADLNALRAARPDIRIWNDQGLCGG